MLYQFYCGSVITNGSEDDDALSGNGVGIALRRHNKDQHQ